MSTTRHPNERVPRGALAALLALLPALAGSSSPSSPSDPSGPPARAELLGTLERLSGTGFAGPTAALPHAEPWFGGRPAIGGVVAVRFETRGTLLRLEGVDLRAFLESRRPRPRPALEVASGILRALAGLPSAEPDPSSAPLADPTPAEPAEPRDAWLVVGRRLLPRGAGVPVPGSIAGAEVLVEPEAVVPLPATGRAALDPAGAFREAGSSAFWWFAAVEPGAPALAQAVVVDGREAAVSDVYRVGATRAGR